MAKSASVSGVKWAQRAGSAGSDYSKGARETTKDQSSSAIAAKAIYQQALQESFGRDAFAKGLQKSGKQGWLNGVMQKGENNYSVGVTAPSSLSKYTTESARFDGARNAAANIARGPKGSPQNLQRVAAVVNALRSTKIGK